MSTEKNADDLLLSIGGCGRYQWRLVVTLHLLQILVVFSLNSNIIISATKEWRCADETICGRIRNVSDFSNSTHGCPVKQCKFTLVDNETVECERFQFHDNTTFVAEWGLVCGKSYIPTTIQSMDLAGVMVGHVISGQIADLVGRRIPLYATILCIIVFNLIGYFSVTWSMLAASRFLLGVGVSLFLTVSYSLSSEFTVNKWRVWAISFPSWFVEVCIFSLFAWLLQDWRYVLLMCALLGVPFLFTWRLIPESFRWYLAHDKIDKATAIIQSVADANRKQYPDLKDYNEINSGKTSQERKYTFWHLFKTRHLIRITLLSAVVWIGLGLISYGIMYGIQTLSGNIYLNLALFNIVPLPTVFLSNFLQNKVGRRITTSMCFLVVTVAGAIAGSVQVFDTAHKGIVTLVAAMVANVGVGTAWGPVQTMTLELYPTVIRSIGYGSMNVVSKAGAILGPQLNYLNTFYPGTLFFICAGVAFISILCCLGLPETKDSNLSDKIVEENSSYAKIS